MKVLPNAFGIAAMFTLDPDTPELATVLSEKHHDVIQILKLSHAIYHRIDNSVRTTLIRAVTQSSFPWVSLLLGASCNDVLPCEVQYLLCNTHIDLLCKHFRLFRLEFWLKPASI
jgi:hypothetical protein